MPCLKCLHIAPHYGGGVGATVTDIANHLQEKYGYINYFVSLDLANLRPKLSLIGNNFFYDDMFKRHQQLRLLIQEADVVVIHYWNHPLLTVTLTTFNFPAAKLLVWVHTSGLYEPNIIPEYLYNVAAKVIYTSEISLTLPEASSPNYEKKIAVARSARNLKSFLDVYKLRHNRRIAREVVYVGTVSLQKMHPDSIKILQELSLRSIKINIVGEAVDNKFVESLVSYEGVTFSGYQSNIIPHLLNADCFVYPLSNRHYGTGELVILEAMASGLPCVCMNNLAESSIIDHCITGYLADCSDDFVSYVDYLLSSPSSLRRLSQAAFTKVQKDFSIEATVSTLVKYINDIHNDNNTYFEGIPLPLSCSDMVFGTMLEHSLFDKSPFLALQNDDPLLSLELSFMAFSILFSQNSVASNFLPNKGVPSQYLKYFPESIFLSELCCQLKYSYVMNR
jgi:glycosyltransferase involved in cell wall biosynthesis